MKEKRQGRVQVLPFPEEILIPNLSNAKERVPRFAAYGNLAYFCFLPMLIKGVVLYSAPTHALETLYDIGFSVSAPGSASPSKGTDPERCILAGHLVIVPLRIGHIGASALHNKLIQCWKAIPRTALKRWYVLYHLLRFCVGKLPMHRTVQMTSLIVLR